MNWLFFLITISVPAWFHAVFAESSMEDCSKFVDCPNSDLMKPCRCSQDSYGSYIVCDGLTSARQLEDIFKMVPAQTKSLTIDNSTMLHIPSSIFQNASDFFLYVQNSTFASIFDRPPNSDSITKITLKNSTFLSGIEWYLISSLNLGILTFENTRLGKLGDAARDGIPSSLRVIKLHNTSTTRINHDFLTNLYELLTLNFGHSNLRNIDTLILPKTLRRLSFRNNHIEHVPNGLFVKLPLLTVAYFSNNSIATIQEEALTGINRTSLDLRDNPINCNCDLEWFVKMRLSDTNIRAVCAEPDNLKGKSIKQLTESDFAHCATK